MLKEIHNSRIACTVLKYLLISSRLSGAAPKLSLHKQNLAILFSSERQIRKKATMNNVLGTVHCQYTLYGNLAFYKRL